MRFYAIIAIKAARRLFLAYVPLDIPVEIEPQQLETFERKGFAVVEWGGLEILP